MSTSCPFCDVVESRTDAKMVHMNRTVVAFHDKHPQDSGVDAGQAVPRAHLPLLGGRPLQRPPG
jgi:hypothetical protein